MWIFDKKFSHGTNIVSVVWQTNRKKNFKCFAVPRFKLIPNTLFFYFSKKNLNF